MTQKRDRTSTRMIEENGKRLDIILSEYQRYKLTSDNGNRIYLTSPTDLFSLKPGFYEIAGSNLINRPWNNTGFIELDITQNTSSSGTRTQYRVHYNYNNRLFWGAMHSNNDWRGWKEISPNQDVSFYLEDALNTFYEKIANLQTLSSKSIGFITDTHYINGAKIPYGENGVQHVRNIAGFSKYGIVDFLIHGGDLINGKTDPSTYKKELYDMVKAMNTASCPKAVLKGNHDFGGWYNANISSPQLSYQLSPLDWYNRMVKPFKNDIVIDSANPSGGYFYRDFDDIKLRVICLNTSDIPHLANGDGSPKYTAIDTYALSNAQLNWFGNTALNFTGKSDATNWNIVVFSHVPLYYSDGAKKVTNGDVCHNIIKAFKAGSTYTSTTTTGDFGQSVSVNFTGKAGRHVANVSGHYHLDQIYLYDTVQYMTLLFSAAGTSTDGVTTDTHDRTEGTETEDCWSVLTIDTAVRKLYLSRFGAGAEVEQTINY